VTGPAQPQGIVELRPGRGVALAWALVGVAALALAAWLVVDTRGHALAVALLVACLVVAGPVVSQLVVPRVFTWRLDAHGLLVQRLHRRLLVSWDEVRFARVVTVGGDPALELHLEPDVDADAGAGDARTGDGGTGGGGGPDRGVVHTLRLPLGADVDALHRELAHHLGAWDGDEAAGPVHPPSGHP
jgi:hypothetical protein